MEVNIEEIIEESVEDQETIDSLYANERVLQHHLYKINN